ncbi:hypothetical protein [Chitinimonas sp.]|uniref:hypothetical protein n=1 Tax=Chitinimonas sp. TaxID=1934313 RepID=UPI002F94A3E5
MNIRYLPLLLGTALLGACAMPQPPQPPREIRIPVREVDAASLALRGVLSYQDKLKQMSSAELGREASRLAEAPAGPATTMEQALLLLQQRASGDLGRAMGLLDNVNRDTRPEAQPFQSLARLLLGMLTEQRKLEEQLDRQAQQQREAQREQQKEQQKKLDQLTEKLEALKAIERSLTSRPTPPANGSKP